MKYNFLVHFYLNEKYVGMALAYPTSQIPESDLLQIIIEETNKWNLRNIRAYLKFDYWVTRNIDPEATLRIMQVIEVK